MYEPQDVPDWVRTHYVRHARGTTPPPASTPFESPGSAGARSDAQRRGESFAPASIPELARGSVAEFDDVDATEITSMPEMREHRPRKRRRRRVAALLFLLSFAAVAGTVTVAGVRMWRDARKPPPPVPAAAVLAGDGRLELAPDRLAIARIGHAGTLWTSPQRTAVDSLEVTASLVLARTGSALVGVDLGTGSPRFTWIMPAGERWGVQAPAELGECLLAISIRGDDALARCIDLARGAPRWTAKIAGGRECSQAPIAVPGAYLVQCPGWTTVIEDRDGTVAFDAGGIGLVQRDPPLLLRGGPKPMLAPWSPATRRFAATGTPVKAAEAASSAVLHAGRLVMRAQSSTDKLATVIPKTGAPVAISAPELQLADDTPLTLDCGSGTSPRFQLLELAPRAGATFDPAAAQHRVLALLDTEAGRLAWTSRKVIPPRRLGAPATPICRHGQYFVPIELRDATDTASSALWILDAESGATTAAVAFAGNAEASFAELAADQIDAERLVGVGHGGAYELHWRRGAPVTVPGLRDARGELERALGRLP